MAICSYVIFFFCGESIFLNNFVTSLLNKQNNGDLCAVSSNNVACTKVGLLFCHILTCILPYSGHYLLLVGTGTHEFLAATKQLYEWFMLPVCPSACLSHLFHYGVIIVLS